MNWTIILAIACGVVVAQGLFLGISLIAKNSDNSKLYLGITLIALSIRVGKSLVYYFATDMSLWGVAIGGAGLWLTGPLLVAYLQGKKPDNWTKVGVQLIPALLVLLSGSVLLWGGMYWIYLIGVGHLLIYITFGFFKFNTLTKPDKVILTGFSLVALCFVYQLASNTLQSYAIGGLVASIFLYTISTFILVEERKTKTKKAPPDLDKATLNSIYQEIQKLFSDHETYRESKLTLSKVASRVNQPVYLVRQAIIQESGNNSMIS